MKKILYICDRCKEEIEGNPVKIIAEEVSREDEDYLYNDPYPELKSLDFCKNCGDLIVSTIKGKCAKGAPAKINREFEKAVEDMVTESTVSPPTESSRHKLDIGKVGALRKAGWSVKAIAEEMSCSDQAVYNALKKLGMSADKKKAPEPEPAEQSKTN